MADSNAIRRAYEAARADLLAECNPSGHWIGELSDSALSTATAASALAMVLREGAEQAALRPLIDRAVEWLARAQNADGGWGDTDKSPSNLATTMLVLAAFHLAEATPRHVAPLRRAEDYISSQGFVEGLRRRYRKDETFAAPILANCAMAGLLLWREVPALPFELACLPKRLLGLLRLPVVSYAIPALVAVGQARNFYIEPQFALVRSIRRRAIRPSRRVLRRMQPASGGFLEATPLTSFVVMSLASIGLAEDPIVQRGVEFLRASVRPSGAWPIDTNLATWTSTLAVGALADTPGALDPRLLDWLLSCQHRGRHPMTGSARGGWGWTDLSGAVPDVDDTSGALLALRILSRQCSGADPCRIRSAVSKGVGWLLRLQNSDGGWPTFCRGWGRLPFDRSGTDLTAHAVRALAAWPEECGRRGRRAIGRGLKYLARQQRPDGSWVPLWFGNQHQPEEENPIYGTARVLLAYRDLDRLESKPARRGLQWLASRRNADGGWGGDLAAVSSVEETALATEALVAAQADPSLQVVAREGLSWLVRAVAVGRHRQPAPIGFYFARLWYYERLYPLVFTVSALGRAVAQGQFLPDDPRLGSDSAQPAAD